MPPRCLELPYLPVPVSRTIWGLAPPLSENASDAVRVPIAVGMNSTLTVQLELPTRSGGQESNAITKSPAFMPMIPTLFMTSTLEL